MTNRDFYEALAENEPFARTSYIGIIPKEPFFTINEEYLRSVLSVNKTFKFINIKTEGDAEYTYYLATIEYHDTTYHIDIYTAANDPEYLQSLSFGNRISEEDKNIALTSPEIIYTDVQFNIEEPLTSYHLQLKVLYAIVPDSCMVVDRSAFRLLSPKWLSITANSETPPAPSYLYTIHGVYDDLGNEKYRYWMHTHGLHRCGCLELELLNITSGYQEMSTMLSTAAALFLNRAYNENEKFQIGYDGLGIYLIWKRWEDALEILPKDILGGINDRSPIEDTEDSSKDIHAEPTGVLFAVEEQNLVSPEIYAPTLADNPVYYITNKETARMRALAKERFHLYEKAYRTYGVTEKKSFLGKLFKSKKEEENDWRFMVKLGLVIDNAESESDKEHLWFDVESIENGKVTGVLINSPYWIAALKEGKTYTYPIDEVLTDWLIYGPDYEYNPDSIYLLEL